MQRDQRYGIFFLRNLFYLFPRNIKNIAQKMKAKTSEEYNSKVENLLLLPRL